MLGEKHGLFDGNFYDSYHKLFVSAVRKLCEHGCVLSFARKPWQYKFADLVN